MTELARRKWLQIAIIGLLVFGYGFTFAYVRHNWVFYVLCFVVIFPAAVAATSSRERLRLFWRNLRTAQRAIIISIVAVVLWALDVLSRDAKSNRMLVASIAIGVALLLLAAYSLLSKALDAVWARIRVRRS